MNSGAEAVTTSAGFTPMVRPEYQHLPAPSRASTLLLGLGNDILCDDAIGLHVVREIKKRLHRWGETRWGETPSSPNPPPGGARLGGARLCRALPKPGETLSSHPSVDVQETCEMGLSLLDYIIGYKSLVLVDSIQTRRAPPGHIHELDGKDIKILPITTPHFIGVGEMIALGTQLGLEVPQQVKIFAIEVQDPFTITTQMTPALRSALPRIVERILPSLV